MKRKGDLELARPYANPQGRSLASSRTCTRPIRGSFRVTSYNRAGNVAYGHRASARARARRPAVRDGALERSETAEASGVRGGPRYQQRLVTRMK